MIIRLVITTLIPLILAGTLNMAWCKAPVAGSLAIPLDLGFCLCDGKRLFGNNKTFKGFLGMWAAGAISMTLWGLICSVSPALNEKSYIYEIYGNTLLVNFVFGSLYGLTYAVFELPNSFIKRRFDIAPGQHYEHGKALKVFFFLLDNSDSAFGCMLVVCLLCGLGIREYLVGVFFGTLAHAPVNLVLYTFGLRKTMF